MLAKLKVECGVQFTQKMEGMFNDMKVSADATRDYHTYLAGTTVCVEHYVYFGGKFLTRHFQGSWNWIKCDDFDLELLANESLAFSLYTTCADVKSLPVFRTVLPLQTFWKTSYMAVTSWKRRCSCCVQISKPWSERFDSCSCYFTPLWKPWGRGILDVSGTSIQLLEHETIC